MAEMEKPPGIPGQQPPVYVVQVAEDPEIRKLKERNLGAIIFSFIATFVCCHLLNVCCGIASIVLAFKGREAYLNGKKEQGKEKTRISFILSSIVCVIGIALIITGIVFAVKGGRRSTYYGK